MTRKLSTEFKRECADLVIVHGYKHKDAAEAMALDYLRFSVGLVNLKKSRKVLHPKQPH